MRPSFVKQTTVVLNFDGACDNNAPVPMMGIGVAVTINGERAFEYDSKKACGDGTSNIAEYLALAEALRVAIKIQKELGPTTFVIIGDSQLVVNQFKGTWEVKAKHLKDYYNDCKSLRQRIHSPCKIEWKKREFNKAADALSKEAVKDYFEKILK